MNNTDKAKLNFFNALLERNPEVNRQFKEYIRVHEENCLEPMSEKDAVNSIQKFANTFREALEEINLDEPDWEKYIPRHSGYIEEYEAMEHMAEDTIDGVFEGFVSEIGSMLKTGEVPVALLKLTALYDACLQANIKDSYDALPELTDFLKHKWNELLNSVNQQLKTQVLADLWGEWYLRVLLNHYRNRQLENDQYLTSFEPILLVLVNSEKLAKKAEQLLSKFHIQKKLLPRLIPKLSLLHDDWDKWAKEAEQLMVFEVEVAVDLLNHYIGKSEDEFIRISNELWTKNLHKSQTADLYFKHLDPEKAPELYKEVVKYLIKYDQTEEYYRILQGLFTEYEKEKFLEKYKYRGKFYAMMLHMEGRHEQLLAHMRKDKNPIAFPDMIPYLYDSHPVESLKLIKEYILYRLSDRKYRRRKYPQIVDLLLSTQKIKGHDRKINELIRIIYNYQPFLPSLRKKMEMGGLVRGQV